MVVQRQKRSRGCLSDRQKIGVGRRHIGTAQGWASVRGTPRPRDPTTNPILARLTGRPTMARCPRLGANPTLDRFTGAAWERADWDGFIGTARIELTKPLAEASAAQRVRTDRRPLDDAHLPTGLARTSCAGACPLQPSSDL